MSSTIVKKITLKDYLNKLSDMDLEFLLDEKNVLIISEEKDKKIKNLINCIEIYFIKYILLANNTQLKLIDNIIKNKTVKVDENLIEELFVIELDGNYIVPNELIKIYKNIIKQGIEHYRNELIIKFYIEANGIISIESLLTILNDCKIKTKNQDIIDCVFNNNYVHEKNYLYENETAYNLATKTEFLSLKQENSLTEYILDVTIMLYLIKEYRIYENGIIEILEKIVGNELATKIANDIKKSIKIGIDYEDNIERLLCNNDIEFSEEEQKLFDMVIYNMYMNTPSWKLNGAIPEGANDKEEHFEDFTKKRQICIYINIYVTINGVMEIEKLLNILKNEYNYKINKNKLIEIATDVEDVKIIDNYFVNSSIKKDMMKEILYVKQQISDYKIINNVEKHFNDFNNDYDKTVNICQKYKIDEELAKKIYTVMITSMLDEELLSLELKDHKLMISKSKLKEFLLELKEIEKVTCKWMLNGYTLNEKGIGINRQTPTISNKVGRNDPCICGSGKKYKKCCGK